MRILAQRLTPFLLLWLVALVSVFLVARLNAVSAQVPPPNFPQASCADGVATVNFNWLSLPGTTENWLDISLYDNGFQPGTYLPAQTSPNATSYTWSGLEAGGTYFWRVNSLSPSGWVTAASGAFVACGAALPLAAPFSCQDRYLAIVHFRWAPMSGGASAQYLDVGHDPSFAPDTFGSVALSPGEGRYDWGNFTANTTAYFRITTLGADGVWYISPTGSFLTACVPASQGFETYLGDHLVIPAANVDAEIWSAKVDDFGTMPDPVGYFHGAWYDFSAFGHLGGYANAGNMVISGHVDCARCNNGGVGTAVFWNVRDLHVGDTAQYSTADGHVYNYVVTGVQNYDPNTDWNPVVAASNADMTLITCTGSFSGGDYNLRSVVTFRKY